MFRTRDLTEIVTEEERILGSALTQRKVSKRSARVNAVEKTSGRMISVGSATRFKNESILCAPWFERAELLRPIVAEMNQ